MIRENCWIEEFPIRSSDSDLNGNCKLTSLLQFFQEVAWHHAEYCGFGYSDLINNNKFWVLSGLIIEVDEYPKWDDIIETKTWPKGMERLYALRDFSMKNKDKIFCNGTSNWLVLDMLSQRPQKPEIVFENFNDFVYIDAIQERPGKITHSIDEEQVSEIKVSYSDIDVNKHVNNVKYVEWVINLLYNEVPIDKKISKLTINFLSETKIHDMIVISKSFFNNTYIFSAMNFTSKKKVFILKLHIC